MHYLVVLCDQYGPEQEVRFRAAISSGQLVTQGNISALIAVVAGFVEQPWEGAIQLALAEYQASDRQGHRLFIRGWAVLDGPALQRLERSAGPVSRPERIYAETIIYGPYHASNVRMVLRDAQVGLIEYQSFDQSVIEATAAAGLYQVVRRESFGSDREALVRHADGTALAFSTEAEASAALMALLATAPAPRSDGREADYTYRAIAPRGPGLPAVNPLGLTPKLTANVGRTVPAAEMGDGLHVHGVILVDGTVLVRVEDPEIYWFVMAADKDDCQSLLSGEEQTNIAEHGYEDVQEEVLAYLDEHVPEITARIGHISVHHTAAEAEHHAFNRDRTGG